MSQQAIYEYLKAILPGYLKATRAEKTCLLTQSENVSKLSRKHLIRRLKEAYSFSSPIKNIVETGYPVLRLRGEDLKRKGVSFHDLTMVFQNVSEAVYDDNCCHLNKRGNLLLGKAMGTLIRQDFERNLSQPVFAFSDLDLPSALTGKK